MAQELELLLASADTTAHAEKDDEYSIPLCMDDIITICQQYSVLGYNIQQQINSIVDVGVEESIRSGVVKLGSLSHIKDFLRAITSNAYFGDAASQADDCISAIKQYEGKQQTKLLN